MFTDANGIERPLRITTWTVSQVRDECNVDLTDIPKLLEKIKDAVTLCDVLYVVCRESSDEKLTRKEFYSSIAGDVIESATNALLDGVINFFPDPNRRDAMKRLMSTIRDKGQVMLNQAVTKLGEETEKLLISFDSALNSVASSE